MIIITCPFTASEPWMLGLMESLGMSSMSPSSVINNKKQ